MRLSSLAGLMLLLAGLAQAQNPTPFDCQFSGTLTAASPTSAAYFNKGPTAPCVSFRVTYYTTNASGVSLSLQGTGSLPNGNPDTAHWTNLTAQTGSSNPAIGTVSGSISAAYDYYPWIQLTAGTLTGTNATLTYTTLAYKGDSAKLNGGGSITGGPFTSGDVVTGAGGQAIQDSGTLLSSLIVNPMTAVGDMIAGGTSPAGVPTRVPPNVSLVPRVLTQSGDGTNAGQPTWSVIASTTVNGASCALGGSCTANWISGSISNLHIAQFTGTSGEIQDGGVLGSAASHAATDFALSGASTTVNGASCALGGSCTANWISGSISNLHIAQFTGTSGEIQDGGVLGSAASHAATDFALSGASTTVNGASCALGGSCTANWISGSISNLHIAQFTGTSGEIQDGGVLGSAASHAATDFQAAGSYVAGASALTTQYNIPIVSGTPGTLMQGGLFNPSGGVLAPMAADSTTAIQLCRHNGTTCDVTYDSTNGRVGIGTTGPTNKLVVQNGTLGSATSFDPTPTINIIGNNVTSRSSSTAQQILYLHQPNTFGQSKGSAFGIGLAYWEDPASNYPRTRVDFQTTGRTTDSVQAANTVMSLLDNGNVGIGTTTPVYGLDAASSGASGTARFWDQTATTGSTLVTITPGAAQTSASKVFSVGGVVEMLASTFLLNGHTCSIVSTVVTCP